MNRFSLKENDTGPLSYWSHFTSFQRLYRNCKNNCVRQLYTIYMYITCIIYNIMYVFKMRGIYQYSQQVNSDTIVAW
jgi:hypothetical protein